MLKSATQDKSTKCCALTVYLVTGVRMEGTYHVSTGTSSAIRPSDALRDCKDGFLVLTDVTIHENGRTREQGAVLVRAEAIAYIDLPAGKGWAAREAVPAAVGNPAPARLESAGATRG